MASNQLTKTTTAGSSYTTTYGAAVYLTFNDKQIMLTAADLKIPRFSYVAESFYDAVTLGTIGNAITTIASKIEGLGAAGLETSIKSTIDGLSNIPVLKQIVQSDLVITEFVISPETAKDKKDGNYSFGFGLRLTSNNKLGPITLDGIAFTVGLKQTS